MPEKERIFTCPETNPSPGWRYGKPCARTDEHGPFDAHHDTFEGGTDAWVYAPIESP